MPVSVSCACGKQLRVPDQYVGRRVKCPACGEGLLVEDDSAPEMLIAEAPRQIRFSCGKCGKEMQAKAEYAGKQTKCPGCQSMVKIEEPKAAAPSPSKITTKPKARAAAAVEDEEEDEAPVRRKGSKNKKTKPKKRAVWPWILAGVGSFLVIVGVVLFLIFGLGNADGKLTDLDIIPGDAQAIVGVKIGDVWKVPGFQQGFQQGFQATNPMAAQQMQEMKDFLPGIQPGDVTRLTFVMQTITPLGPNAWMALQSSASINREKYLNSLKLNGRMKLTDKSAGGRTYQQVASMNQFPGQKMVGAHLFNEHLMIFGDEPEIVKVLERGAKVTKAGPSADALKRLAGSDQLVIGGNPPPDAMNQLAMLMQAQLDDVPCQAVKEMQQLLLTASISQNSFDMELSGSLPDGAKAEQVKTALEAGKKKLVIVLGFALRRHAAANLQGRGGRD